MRRADRRTDSHVASLLGMTGGFSTVTVIRCMMSPVRRFVISVRRSRSYASGGSLSFYSERKGGKNAAKTHGFGILCAGGVQPMPQPVNHANGALQSPFRAFVWSLRRHPLAGRGRGGRCVYRAVGCGHPALREHGRECGGRWRATARVAPTEVDRGVFARFQIVRRTDRGVRPYRGERIPTSPRSSE